MEILSVKQGDEIFNIGDVVIHNDGQYFTKIVKFIPGPTDDQMWFYFPESGEDNYVKDLKNFRKYSIEGLRKQLDMELLNKYQKMFNYQYKLTYSSLADMFNDKNWGRYS